MHLLSPSTIILSITATLVAGGGPSEAAILSITKRHSATLASTESSADVESIDVRDLPAMLSRTGQNRRLGSPRVEDCLSLNSAVDTMSHIRIQAVLTEFCGLTPSEVCEYAEIAGDALNLNIICEPNFSVTLEKPEVEAAHGITRATLDGINDTYASLQTGLTEMEVAEAWQLVEESGKRSSDDEIIVAVFDSGVDDQHEDLRDSMWAGPGGSHGYNFVGDSTDVSDRLGHGTHCAGTIAAHRNNGKGITGIAEAKLMSLNICDDSGACNVLLVFRAFEHALEHGARISSHSYLADTGAALLEEAYKNAGATGHVMIFAAGNDNQEIGTSNYPCTLSRLIPTSVCVTHVNLDEPDKYMLAKKANYGPYVDMAAPGIGVLSTLPNSEYGYMSGSSMAAPHVAGVAGVLASMNLTGEDIIRALRASVLPLSESNTKFLKDGGGFLNARQAVINALTLLNGGQVTTRRWGSETTQVLPSGAPESESSTSVSPTRTVPSSCHTITSVLWTSVLLLLIFWA
ncbi:Suppressor of the cold-sensitive snRNP bioproteinsis mutant brr1-1 [Perkinsus olseni]|uniref:subtilisin n=1 Tax=Perkinsus olseni TaxID=32597 RepID=A0A7J6P924_PEROL|nr:Suppressor of the cold-sensitive snRNP bioproteinsis mutant brr1-1 [Perkinsus olseni]